MDGQTVALSLLVQGTTVRPDIVLMIAPMTEMQFLTSDPCGQILAPHRPWSAGPCQQRLHLSIEEEEKVLPNRKHTANCFTYFFIVLRSSSKCS